MRLFSGILASIVVSLLLGFFTSVAEAQQNSCDPDGEFYDARACFEYVRTLEAKNVNAKRDLAASRREASVAQSQFKATKANFTKTTMNLGFDIELRDRTISALGKTIGILSEEKETAWGYVDVISKMLAAAIGLAIFGGIIGFYFLRRRVSDYDRYAIEVRDEKIRELADKLRIETEARIMARDDAATLRRELFHKDPNLWRVAEKITNLLEHVRNEMPRFEAIREMLDRALLLIRTPEERVGELSALVPPHSTV